MSNLLSNLRARLPTGISNLSNKISATNLGTVLTSLNNVFKNSVASCSAFASAFAAEWDFFDGDMIKSKFSPSDINSFFETDGYDLADTLSAVVTQFGVKEDFGALGVHPSLEITTSKGEVLKLVGMPSGVYSFDGEGAYPWPVAIRHTTGFPPSQEQHTRVMYLLHGLKHAGQETYIVLVDMLSDLMENAALSNVFHQAVNILINGGSDMATDFNNLINLVDSKWDSVKSTCTRLFTAWNTGGIYGVICCIIDMIKGVPSMSVGTDGFIAFTQADGLMPQAYTAGIIQVAGTLITSIVSAVVAIWSPIIAVLTSTIGGLITSLVSAYRYNEDVGEKAAMTDSVKAVGGLGVHFGARAKIELSSEQRSALLATCPYLEYDNVVLLPVPGGCLVSYFGSDGKVSYEFHPDIVDRLDWMIQSGIIFQSINGLSDMQGPGGFDPTIDLDILLEGLRTGKIPTFSGSTCKHFVAWSSADPIIMEAFPYSNSSTGALTKDETLLLGCVVAGNMILFQIFMQGMFGPDYRIAGFIDTANPYFAGIEFHDDAGNITSNIYDVHQGTWPIAAAYSKSLFSLLSMASWIAWLKIAAIPRSVMSFDDMVRVCGDIFSCLAYYTKACESLMPASAGIAPTSGLVMTLDYSGCRAYIVARPPFSFICNTSAPTQEAVFGTLSGEPIPMSSDLEFAYSVPKFKPGSVLLGTIKAAVIVAVSTAVIAVVSTVAVRKIRQYRASNAAKAEKAWSDLVENPTKENYAAYAKTVRKNNLFNKIFGGSTLSKNGYWASDSTSGGASEIASRIGEQMSVDENADGINLRSDDSLTSVIRLISGVQPEPQE